MLQDMRLAGLAKTTRATYVSAVRGLAKYFMRPPDQLCDADLRQFFDHLVIERKVTGKSFGVYLAAIRFFYTHTLDRHFPVLDLAHPMRESRIPIVLTQDEVRALLGAVNNPIMRTLFLLIYSCGLRLSEGLELRTQDIDGQRHEIHVLGKGAQERYVPLPASTLTALREHWKQYRPAKPWLFTNPHRGRLYTPSALNYCFRQARKAAGITKPATIHSLRHSYATLLLENHLGIRVIQVLLGHRTIQSTTIYTRITGKVRDEAAETIDRLMVDL